MPEYDFSGRVALVTGAARGQGESHALGYADHGADVVALDVSANREEVPYNLGTGEELEATVAGIEERGQEGLAVRADVSEEGDVERAVETAIEEFGRIDVLANNAGIATPTPAIEIDEATWDVLLDIDLKGTWLCAKHVGQHMVERGEGGRIVSTASSAGLVGQPGLAHYSAAKHGVIGLTKTLALELAEHDITANAVCPSAVETPLIPETMTVYGEESFERISELGGPASVFPDHEALQSTDVTEAYLWLSSDAARYVTGIALPVDAGNTAK
jgi:SDR family mycofactocin-dependent oxidoreductase